MPPGRDARGVALPMVLVLAVLVESLTLVALAAAMIRVRLVADERWRVEGQLVAASGLAESRVTRRADLDSLADGAALSWPAVERPDGWTWRAGAVRTGAVIRLTVAAERRSAAGVVIAAHGASLLLARTAADTVRVLARRPRF